MKLYGSFKSRTAAARRAGQVGGTVTARTINGVVRYCVLGKSKKRTRRNPLEIAYRSPKTGKRRGLSLGRVNQNAPCKCGDSGCPVHKGNSHCPNAASIVLQRVDMDDRTGTAMCEACGDDAMESGLFRVIRTRENPGETSTRSEVRSPTRTSTSTHALTRGNKTMTITGNGNHVRLNPRSRLIYHSVKCIYAQKGPGHQCDPECARANHLYKHDFGPGVRCIGLANGDVLLTKKG